MINSRSLVRALAGGLPLVGLAIVLSSHGGSASSAQEIRFRDDCNPASFNAIIGPGTCVGNGNTTFPKLIQELNEDQTAGAWRINPDQTGIDSGQPTLLENRGGELHTFTKVVNFGGGIVQPLNDAAGIKGVAPECASLNGNPTAMIPNVSTPVFPGSAISGPLAGSAGLPVGKTNFQCCIHPWMHTTIEVKTHH